MATGSATSPDPSPGETATAETLRQVFDASPSAMLLVAVDGAVRLANRQAERLFGHARGTMVGLAVESLVPERYRSEHAAHRRGYFDRPVERAMGEGRDLYGLRRDGSEVPIEIGLNPIRTDEGWFVLAAIVDISARKRSEDLLRGSLREKETLLHEIHHRVKNNMQLVSSLLSLQAGNIPDPGHRTLFEDCQSRIRTMALIHEKLYSSGNLAAVAAAEYLRDLLRLLMRSHLSERTGIRLELEVEAIDLQLEVAIPIGLIVHELVTNALRHGFRDRSSGLLRVSLGVPAPARCRLRIGDDGKGLPADFVPAQSRGLGMRMVSSLSRQLDGNLQVERAGGTTFTIEFPLSTSTQARSGHQNKGAGTPSLE